MKNISEIKSTLIFYVLANKLKTTVVEEINNYSIADNLFGSMILAIAMNSEFKETDELGKLLRMMVLDDFSRLNPDYSLLDNLKKGRQYKEEIDEARSLQTKISKLIYKYKMLDFLLSRLILEQGDTLEYTELIQEGVKVMKPKSLRDYIKYEAIIRFYYLNFRLKNKVRTGWDNKHWNINSDRVERISEHIVGTIALALVMDSEFDYNGEVDKDRIIDIDEVIKLLVLHEIGEVLIGDITPFDGITKEEKKEMERKAIIEVVGNLSDKERIIAMLFDFLEPTSNEAKFAYLCDKIEADLQSKYYQDSGLHQSLDNQQNNCSFASAKVQRLLEDGAQTAFDIWYGLDKGIYENMAEFSEFGDKLDVIRDNNMRTLSEGIIKQKVGISFKEHKYLVEEISKAVNPLFEDDEVDAIYMIAFQSKENEKGVIYLEVLLKDSEQYSRYKRVLERINWNLVKNNKTGIQVNFGCGHASDYSVIAMNPSEVYRVETLTEATIIFDKSGALTEVKKEMMSCRHVYPFYLVDYEPPIDDAVILNLRNEQN